MSMSKILISSSSLEKMALNCVFCKIVNHTEKADICYENDELIIFKDIKPASRNHVLIVPKIHIKDAKSLKPENKDLVERMIAAGEELFRSKGFDLSDTLQGFHWPPFYSMSHLHLHFIHPVSEMGFISRAVFKPGTFWFVKPDYVLNKLANEGRTCRL